MANENKNGQPLLRVENLSLNREGRQILQNITLAASSGQIHAILGVNGSGKSSLAYALMGCSGYAPDGGRIWFGGQDITQLPIDERGRLGMTLAWQEPARFEGLPVGKYLTLGANSNQRDRAQAALMAVSLAPAVYLRRRVDDTLSGGERKRVELAAVYAMRPWLAILDEPDSGIDALSLEDIRGLLRRMADAGTAVLLITHRNEMAVAADLASIMCMGSIVFTGPPDRAQAYYQGRCEPHLTALGKQPWRELSSTPEVKEIVI